MEEVPRRTSPVPLAQDDGKGGLGLRGVAFMTVLAVLAVLKSTLPSFCSSYKIQCEETTVTVLTILAVSAVVAVPVVTATPLELNPPLSVILTCVPLFVHCLIRVEAEGLLDYQGWAGIISIVQWNLRPVIFGVDKLKRKSPGDRPGVPGTPGGTNSGPPAGVPGNFLLFTLEERTEKGISRVFLNPWFGEPMVCTLDSRGFRHFRGFRDFRESSTQLLVCSCLSCLRRFRRSRDFRRFRERRPAPKP